MLLIGIMVVVVMMKTMKNLTWQHAAAVVATGRVSFFLPSLSSFLLSVSRPSLPFPSLSFFLHPVPLSFSSSLLCFFLLFSFLTLIF